MSRCFKIPLRCFSSASSKASPGANKYVERLMPKRILKVSEQTPNFEAQEKVERISEAVQRYLQNYQANVEFFEKKDQEYELGKRHLANIMGYDPEKLTREQIEVSFFCGRDHLLGTNSFFSLSFADHQYCHIKSKTERNPVPTSIWPFRGTRYAGNAIASRDLPEI